MNTLSNLRMLSVRIGWQTMGLHLFPLSTPLLRRGNTLLEAKWCEQTRREAVGSNDNDVCQSGNAWPGHHSSLHHLPCCVVSHSLHLCFTLLWLFWPALICFISIWISCVGHTFRSLLCSAPSSHPIRALSVLCVSGTPLPLWTYSTHALKSNKQLAKPELPVFAFAKDRWNQFWIKPI